MIDHEAIRQICPDAVTIVTDSNNKTIIGTDDLGRPSYIDTPVAYDAGGTRLVYDLTQAMSISKLMSCKRRAKQLLSLTDWSALPDVGLVNSQEFTAYRAQIRALMITPVEDPEWPTQPSAVWS